MDKKKNIAKKMKPSKHSASEAEDLRLIQERKRLENKYPHLK